MTPLLEVKAEGFEQRSVQTLILEGYNILTQVSTRSKPLWRLVNLSIKRPDSGPPTFILIILQPVIVLDNVVLVSV